MIHRKKTSVLTWGETNYKTVDAVAQALHYGPSYTHTRVTGEEYIQWAPPSTTTSWTPTGVDEAILRSHGYDAKYRLDVAARLPKIW